MSAVLQRLSGPTGLATAVSAALACDPADFARTLLVFDFDRTLTNGISKPGDEAELGKVVRGGEATVAALDALTVMQSAARCDKEGERFTCR